MAALVQSFPQQSSTVTMLQARPSSASGILQSTSQNQMHQYGPGSKNLHRNSYHGIGTSAGSNTYRGQASMTPIAPYAFTSTPALTGHRPQQTPYVRQDQRTTSAPAVPTIYGSQAGQPGVRQTRYPAPASVSTTTSSSSSELSLPAVTDDTTVLGAQVWEATRVRPQSTIFTPLPALSSMAPAPVTSAKPAPERYRRPANRRSETAPVVGSNISAPVVFGSNTASFYQLAQTDNGNGPQAGNRYQGVSAQAPQILTQNFNSGNTFGNSFRGAAVDDMYLRKHATRDDKHRRRSIHTIDATHLENSQQPKDFGISSNQHPLRSSPVIRPSSSPGRSDLGETLPNHRPEPRLPSGPKRESSVITAGTNPAPPAVAAVGSPKHDNPQLVNIPPRGSSSDATKRIAGSSPLSKPMTMGTEPPVTKDIFASTVTAALQAPVKASAPRPQSPAAKQLAALNDKGGKKPSRLRRAFSFGSAAELRKASIEHDASNNSTAAADKAQLRKEELQDEHEAEQARIAQKQEEGGIGSGIYNGQGRFFTGSTDNLSISSTASSASIMIRKMGKGMKKSTRSLVGLFRPKSVIGVPAADSALPQASVAEVSMVNVEAERQGMDVSSATRDQNGGGFGLPKLELDLLEGPLATLASGSTDNVSVASDSAQRKSILGGEKDRAEVLAAVKKGILKRSGTDSGNSSPVVLPVDHKAMNFGLPQIPHVDDSPLSSAPSTPNSDVPSHRRTESVTLNGEDYFMSALRFSSNSKSSPATPAAKRNISWKSAAIHHDTWASTEYDRRSEVATCNRLTPMLAQQIKEELNTFKMEMEVHENSKIYTHFF